jgi:hypothetical protein
VFEPAIRARRNPTKEIVMTSDERYEGVPEKKLDDTVPAGETTQVEGAPTGFPDRWGGGADDTQHAGDAFGERYSGEPSDSAVKAEELGDRWGKGSDDSSERSEVFGATYAGDNQEPHDE